MVGTGTKKMLRMPTGVVARVVVRPVVRPVARAAICAGICVVIGAAAGACSSSSAPPKVASLASPGATSAGGSGGSAAGSKNDPAAWADYAKCLRDHGIDMPDPAPGGVISFGDTAKQDPAKLTAAMDACRTQLPAGKGSGPLSAADQVRELQRAQCLRAHGVPVQDPLPGQDLVVSGSHLDPATVQAAVDACRQPAASTSASGS